MLIFLAAFNSLLSPYWDTYKKYLSKKGFASLTIICSPNLVEHSMGIIILLSLGLFVLPADPHFYFYWFIMVIISAVELTLNLRGLVKSNFFGVRVVGSLSFVVSSIAAVFFIREHVSLLQYGAIGIAIMGVALFTWPKGQGMSFKNMDKGIVFVVISVILSGISLIPYKMATFYTPDYSTFLTGRIVGDLVAWNLVWLASLLWVRRSPIIELKNLVSTKEALTLIAGASGANLLMSWLIYEMPVTDLSILGTLGIVTSYFLSSYKYGDHLTGRMYAGTICILASIGLFFIK
jgi:drug/metabolite transporter (DMT)-like permease